MSIISLLWEDLQPCQAVANASGENQNQSPCAVFESKTTAKTSKDHCDTIQNRPHPTAHQDKRYGEMLSLTAFEVIGVEWYPCRLLSARSAPFFPFAAEQTIQRKPGMSSQVLINHPAFEALVQSYRQGLVGAVFVLGAGEAIDFATMMKHRI